MEGGRLDSILLNVEAGINVEVGNNYEINKRAGWIFVSCRVEFSKIGKRDVTFIREMRVHKCGETIQGRKRPVCKKSTW